MARPVKIAQGFVSIADVLFEVGTTTDKKWVTHQSIAQANKIEFQELFGVTAWFHAMREHAVFHSDPENEGSRTLNVRGKHTTTGREFDELRPGASRHFWYAQRLVEDGFFPSVRHFNSDRILHVSHDYTMGMEVPLWERIEPKLAEHGAAPHHLIVDRVDDEGNPLQFEGTPMVSIEKIGPLIATMSNEIFYRLAREAEQAMGGNYKAVLTNQITCLVTRMGDPPGAPEHKAEAEKRFYLHEPRNLARLHAPEDFQSSMDAPHVAISSRVADYVRSEDNPEKQIVRQLIEFAVKSRQSRNVLEFRSVANENTTKAVTTRKKPKPALVVQPAVGSIIIGGKEVHKTGGAVIKEAGIATLTPAEIEQFITANSAEFDLGKTAQGRELMQHANGVFLKPIDPTNEWQLTDANLKFNSLCVAKELDPRYLGVPFIILNLRNCHKTMLQADFHNTNAGYSKNFALGVYTPDAVMQFDGVEHYPTFSYHVLTGDDERSLMRAAKRLKEKLWENYVRLELPGQFDPMIKHGGTPIPQDLTTFFPAGSASNENRFVCKDAYDICRFAAEQGFAMAWGANDYDDRVMGAFRKGYHDGHGPWLFGASTHDIVKVETMNSRIPADCNAWQLSRAISTRMSTLITGAPDQSGQHKRYFNGSDIFLGLPGGRGTYQENIIFLAMKKLLPNVMQGRAAIFDAPAGSPTESHLLASFGAQKLRHLQRDHQALADEGVFLSTSAEETKLTMLDIRDAQRRAAVIDQRQRLAPQDLQAAFA